MNLIYILFQGHTKVLLIKQSIASYLSYTLKRQDGELETKLKDKTRLDKVRLIKVNDLN